MIDHTGLEISNPALSRAFWIPMDTMSRPFATSLSDARIY